MRSHLANDIIPITDLMHGAVEVIKKLKSTRRPLLITQNGRAAMICLDVSEYESQRKKIEMIESLLEGERALAAGRFAAWEDFEKALDAL